MNAESIMRRDLQQLSTLIQSGSPTYRVYKNGIQGGINSIPALDAHELKIQAVWTLKRASRVLNEEEAMYCIAQFGCYTDTANALQSWLDIMARHIPREETDAILEYLFLKRNTPVR